MEGAPGEAGGGEEVRSEEVSRATAAPESVAAGLEKRQLGTIKAW